MPAERPLCVVIGALGGQGGGLLADWLAAAARADGFPAQATSIPGVAQRTGATTYYFELYPERTLAATPIFSLFPSAGDVDLVAALEPTEAGRALGQGLVTAGTTVITLARRVFSTAEKDVAGDGTVAAQPILEALARASGRLIRLDGIADRGALNALMLGAIAGSGVLPLATKHCREAIRERGVAVEANLRGFDAGLELAHQTDTNPPSTPRETLQYDATPPSFVDEVAALPPALQPIVGHALARLVDYQGTRYARHFLRRLGPVIEIDRAAGEDGGWRLTQEVARRLAAWMSHEDAIRVAQLKTRPGRLARIRSEVGADAGDLFRVVDYLKPGTREIAAVLPRPLARLLPRGGAGRPVRIPVTSPWGYGLLRLLALARPLRPLSTGHATEQALIERWLAAIATCGLRHYELASLLAEVAVWARGYGDVRERGHARLQELLQAWEAHLAEDPDTLRETVKASLHAARHDPDTPCRGEAGGLQQ